MYIYKFFLFFLIFERLIFSFKKFQEIGAKFLFQSFRNSFSTSYLPIYQEGLDQNRSLTLIIENFKCSEKQNGKPVEIWTLQDNFSKLL